MDTELAVVFLLFSLVIFALYHGFQAYEDKQRIRQYLKRKGATNIGVSWQWWGGDRANHVYDVNYSTPSERQRFAQCKIRSAWWSDKKIYWSEPPEV